MHPANNFARTVTSSILFTLLAACLGILLSSIVKPASAQNVASGAIAGQVTDPQGSGVPGATVKLTETSINSVSTTNTNEAGRYAFPTVPSGTYELTVTKEGFALTRIAVQKVGVR